MSYFTELGLAEPVLRALGTKGYTDPTPIQRQAIPALLEGRDLLGIAQTGTGKTAAFALPSIHRLAADPKARKPAACRMLVLSPTRELAAQIADNMRAYGKYLALNVQCVVGGMPLGKQARALVPGCDILIATPGRLLDLIEQRALTLRHVEIFVLDEADQMMDLGFIHALKRISTMLPKERQSLFFSATMPKAIADLGKQFINDPVRVEVTPQATTAERVEQYATFLNQGEKQALLTLKLRDGLGDGSIERALVFARTKHGADRVVKHLVTAGVRAAAIHGNKSQGQRTAAIKDFKSGHIPVLIATDIAARGIDIPGVSHVFNYELPNVAEQYVHRIGRTARNGADGIALSFVAPDERAYLRDIERLTRVKLEPMPLPADFAREASRLPLPARKAGADEDTRDSRQPRRQPARAQDNTPRPRATHSAEPTAQFGKRAERPAAAARPLHARPDRDGEAAPFARRAPADRNGAPAHGQHRQRDDRAERTDHRDRPERTAERPHSPQRERPAHGGEARPARHGEARPAQGGERRAAAPGTHRERPVAGDRAHTPRPHDSRRDRPAAPADRPHGARTEQRTDQADRPRKPWHGADRAAPNATSRPDQAGAARPRNPHRKPANGKRPGGAWG